MRKVNTAKIKRPHGVLAFASIATLVGSFAFAEVQNPNLTAEEARNAGVRVAAKAPQARGLWERLKSAQETVISSVAATVQDLKTQFFAQEKPQQPKLTVTQSGPAAGEVSKSAPAPSVPMPAGRSLASTSGATSQAVSDVMSMPGLSRSSSGVVKYEIEVSPEAAIPRLRVPSEERFVDSKTGRFELDARFKTALARDLRTPLSSPTAITADEMKVLTRPVTPVALARKFKDLAIARGKVDPTAVNAIRLNLAMVPHKIPESLAKFTPLTDEEFRFLSGLLLYQNGFQCAAAVGLFHSISSQKEWQAEADYYLAMCSRSMGLMTDFSERARRVFASGDAFYAPRLISEVNWETPNVTDRSFGEALERAMKVPEVSKGQKPEMMATIAALIAESAAAAEKFKTAMEWAKKVPDGHPRYLQARFVEALSEYSIGSKKRALDLQESLIRNPKAEGSAREFQGLIALNLARMYFQEQKYKEAHEAFLTVNKDHPLWLQGLTEMGWAQLLSGDFEGAIGNMYSIHSPFFAAAYKPESYVIRTIGYLNLCQYGDAYRTLSTLEKDYRLMLDSVDTFEKSVASFKDGRYGTVRRFLQAFSQKDRKGDLKELDGLPGSIIREVARQKDFLNLQKSLNRQIDERAIYGRVGAEIERNLKDAQAKVNQSRKRLDVIRREIAMIRSRPDLEATRLPKMAELDMELSRLNDRFFMVDLFNEAKRSVELYNREVVQGADKRGIELKAKMESVIANRLKKLRTDLARFLDNNELLRYEVFAASGENIRYQVAGGEKSNRVPANVIPKSKSLHWDFDGEYWEDEIGHYRSSLKNNCPDPSRRAQAALGGGEQ